MFQTYHIIKTYTPSLKEDLSRKAINKGKPDLGRKQPRPPKLEYKNHKYIA